MEDKIDTLTDSVKVMQDLLLEQQNANKLLQQNLEKDLKKNASARSKGRGNDEVDESTSETTIYHNLFQGQSFGN